MDCFNKTFFIIYNNDSIIVCTNMCVT